ncbi:hypothetical protein E4656_11120 [Natronospirillum operosum]|uniref:Fis family transcriptional regulator n=1 Tax=Natronospirillum operosum TaxID=2759953 RepID=A0A4Z0WB47_9GAMM|nr:hypothetical protein [Natronospirillum operosum]TGG93585.1 hypothetical protein E4656_11120 [Natronospirillum operosum]
MTLTKRQSKQLERQLVAALTEACETAKAEVPGFIWLTHDTGGEDFPAGLRVTWIFDSQDSLDNALAGGQGERMRALTQAALAEADIEVPDLTACVQFDNEEACARAQAGNWQARLAQLRRSRH